MTTELHVAWVYDCDECGRENFLRATTGDAHEAVMMMQEDADIVALFVAEEENVTHVSGEMYEAPQLISEIAIAPRTVTCQHCGHTAAAEAPKLDEEDHNGPHPSDDGDLDSDRLGDDQPPSGADQDDA